MVVQHAELTEAIIGAAIEVHRTLGPGLLEQAYETCLAHELGLRGMHVVRQVPLALRYKGLEVESAYKLDLIVSSLVVVELKSVDRLHPVYDAQVITYLKLSGLPIGLLINFNVPLPKGGIRRFAL